MNWVGARMRYAMAAVAVAMAVGACSPASHEPSPQPTTAEVAEIPQWRLEQRAETEALTLEWADAPAVFGQYSVTQGIGVSDPSVPIVEAVDGRTAGLIAGGGTVEEPDGSGEYYLVLPMLVTESDAAGVEIASQECTGRLFGGQVAECGGWVVRAVGARADGGGVFEVLAVPEGFSRQTS